MKNCAIFFQGYLIFLVTLLSQIVCVVTSFHILHFIKMIPLCILYVKKLHNYHNDYRLNKCDDMYHKNDFMYCLLACDTPVYLSIMTMYIKR